MAYRDLILTNFRRKLFSLLLAILIWSTIHFTDQKRHSAVRVDTPTNSMNSNP